MSSNPFSIEQAALDALPIGTLILSPENRVAFWNSWLFRSTGISPNKIHDKPLFEFFDIPNRGKLCL
ncbi:MAG: PAS domain-containing protein, partial [Chthoniobacterales bacterium]|nr:PAS domain-containing protein [Chthoniobacterales bacterium]